MSRHRVTLKVTITTPEIGDGLPKNIEGIVAMALEEQFPGHRVGPVTVLVLEQQHDGLLWETVSRREG